MYYLTILVLLVYSSSGNGQSNPADDQIRKPIVQLRPQVYNNDAFLRLVVDFIQKTNPDLQEIFNGTESEGIQEMFDVFSTLDSAVLDSAFSSLNLNITCFKNLLERYPLDYSTFQRFEISMPHLLAAINMHVGGIAYGHMWEAFGLNANLISTYQIFQEYEALFNLVQQQGIFTHATMANVLNYFTANTITQRIALFNGRINMTLIDKFTEIYETNDFLEVINVCGIEPQNLVNALNQLPQNIYRNFRLVQGIEEILKEDITFGTVVTSNEIVTKLNTKAFDLQEMLSDYCHLVAVTSTDVTYIINNTIPHENYTTLTTTDILPEGFPFADVNSKITNKYCTYFTADDGVVTTRSTQIYLQAPYAWISYAPGISENILDGSPLICKNTNNQLILFGLSMHDYVYPANNSVRFDLLRELAYQNVVGGTADRILFASGVSSLQQTIQDPVLHNAVAESLSGGVENLVGGAQDTIENSPIAKAAKDTSDKLIDSALQDALLSDNTLQLTDDVGDALHSAQAFPAQGVEVVSNLASGITKNEALDGVGDTITGVIKTPTEMVGNATGQVSVGVLDQDGVFGGLGGNSIVDVVQGVGDNADNVGLDTVGGTLWSLSEDALIGDVVQQAGNVLDAAQSANVVENVQIPDLPIIGNSGGLPSAGIMPVHSINVPFAGLG